MFIVSQDKEEIYNTDQMKSILRDEEDIKIAMGDDYESIWAIASYDNEERAKEVMEQVLSFLRNAYVRDVFYMPKE